jgi:N-acetyl-anhydromuramyl-L-alanine amidase AmpD
MGTVYLRSTTAAVLLLLAAACGQAPADDAGRLAQAMETASAEYAVPRPILEAIGYSETRWWMRPGEPSRDMGYGAMHLVDAGPEGPLARAAQLTGLSEEALKTDLDANVRGAAALLRATADRYFAETRSKDERELAAWWQVVMRYPGVDDPVAADLFASIVYQVMGRGARAVLPDGSSYSFAPHPVQLEGEKLFGQMASALVPDYALARGVDASRSNYTTGRGATIDKVVIHMMQGSYAGSISWFRNPSSGASAHYMVRSSDGEVTQMVKNADTAWHSGNWDTNISSIGIEHEGYVNQPQWFTEAMYRASANLTRWLCDTYGIPKDRQHVIGHNEVPSTNTRCGPNPSAALAHAGGSSCHHDPCVTLNGTQCFWDWQHYMDLVGATTTTTHKLKGFVYARLGQCPEIPATSDPGFGDCVRLAGARVFVPETGRTVITGDGTTNAQTNPNGWPLGYWEFTLPGGKYTPSASFPGYLDGVTWRGPGGVTVGPPPPPADGTWASFTLLPVGTPGGVKGVVYEVNAADPSDRSKVLDGALVAAGSNVVTTVEGGKYALVGLPPGNVTLTVTKTGYKQGTGSVTIVAGQQETLDVGLSAADSKPPRVTFTAPADNVVVGYTPVLVEGTVDDPTATLKVANAAASFANGRFSLPVALKEGLNTIVGEAIDAAGNTGRAVVRINYDPARTGLTGKVIDAFTQAPVKDAVVAAGDVFARTGADGVYALDLPAGDVALSAQAVNYLARTLTVSVKGGARTFQDIALVPTSGGALIEITTPADGVTLTSPSVDVTGLVRIPNLAAVKVNDAPATVEADGTFKATITLAPGENVIVARGRGTDGLEASAQVTVTLLGQVGEDGCGCAGGLETTAFALFAVGLLRRRRSA